MWLNVRESKSRAGSQTRLNVSKHSKREMGNDATLDFRYGLVAQQVEQSAVNR